VKLLADAILTKHVDCIKEQSVALQARPFGSQREERPQHPVALEEAGSRQLRARTAADALELPAVARMRMAASDLSAQTKQQQLWLTEQQQLVGAGRATADQPATQQKEQQQDRQQEQQQQPASGSAQARMPLAAQDTPVPPEVKAVAADPAPSARCKGAQPLQPGLYSLLAATVDGADWASWGCVSFRHADLAQQQQQGQQRRVNVTVSAVPMYSPGAVELAPGHTYTCVAHFRQSTHVSVAATSSADWDMAVRKAVDSAVRVAHVEACPTLSYVPPLRGSPPPRLAVQGNRLVAQSKAGDRPFQMHGINWFGFNVPMGVVDGLWAGGTDLATDFGKITYQLKLLGYNAVRLPFTHRNLANTQVSDVVRDCTRTTEAQLRQRVVDPKLWHTKQRKELPPNFSPLFNHGQASACNTYLPGRSNQDRLLFVLQQLIAQGMYVVLDYQPMGTEEHAYNLQDFVSAWADLWKAVSCLPNFQLDIAGRVLVDVMNEPDSMNVRWEATNSRPGAQQLYLATADALWQMTPRQVLFMFEGTGQNILGLSWGNGFVTDINVINSRGLSDPNPFFQRLLSRPYVDKVCACVFVCLCVCVCVGGGGGGWFFLHGQRCVHRTASLCLAAASLTPRHPACHTTAHRSSSRRTCTRRPSRGLPSWARTCGRSARWRLATCRAPGSAQTQAPRPSAAAATRSKARVLCSPSSSARQGLRLPPTQTSSGSTTLPTS
jgi:hypothetical protein